MFPILFTLGPRKNLVRGDELEISGTWELPPYGFVWLLSE